MSGIASVSAYKEYIDLQNYTGAAPGNSGSIYLSGSAASEKVYFNRPLDVSSKAIENLADPSNDQDAATKAYVDSQVTGQDLDFSGDSGGAQSVDLDSQSLTIAGTANEIETAGSAQTITIGLPDDVTIGNDLTVTSNADVGGTFNVDGASTMAAITMDGILSSSAAVTLLSGITMDGNLDANGNADVAGTFNVDGASTMAAITMDGILSCSAGVEFDSTLDVGGALNVDGASTMAAITMDGVLSSSAAVTLLSGITMDGALDANSTADFEGAVNMQSTLYVTGAADFISSVAVYGELHHHSTAQFDGIATFDAAIDANSTSDFQGAMNLQSTITVAGAADLNGALDVAGAVSLAASGVETDIRGTLVVDERASFEGTFAVTGAADFSGGLDVSAGGLSANSLLVDDLTDNRVVIVGTNGELEDDANFTFDGTTLTLGSSQDVKARSFITYSDAALKENVETVTNAMDMIQGLRGVSYDLKNDGKREYGFIAQEVNNVVPEVVSVKDNMMGIDYTRITSLLVEAVKTQQAQIEALTNKLDK